MDILRKCGNLVLTFLIKKNGVPALTRFVEYQNMLTASMNYHLAALYSVLS